MCELGRIDLGCEVSMLSAFSAAPRQGHLLGVVHLFAWVKMHRKTKLVLDPKYMEHDNLVFQDWGDFCPGVKQQVLC